jgi:DNA polymerase
MSSPTETLTLREALGAYVRILRDNGEKNVRLSADSRRALATLINPPSAASLSKAAPAVRTPSPVGQSSAPKAAPAPGRTPASSQRTSPPRPVVRAPSAASVVPKFEAVESAPIEIRGATRVEKLANLATLITPCAKCPHLAESRTQTVFGVGSPDAELMFVGEAPGADEDKQGEPFVGLAGQLLTKMIAAMGLSRDKVYIANVLKCRPDMPKGSSGNRKPTSAEMQTCLPYLLAQIEIIQPKIIVALGATAVEGLFGPFQPGTTIGKLRGKFLEFHGTPTMPTFHPSYLLRNQSPTEKRKVWEDLLQVMERLALPISTKQRGYFLSKA